MVVTESDAMLDILSWSASRPAWQRDALRRLISQNGELTESDVDELVSLCKNPDSPYKPIAIEHISAKNSDAPTVALKSICNIQNVNALAENQSLTFIPKGITIIYGDNGSGKSGYVRILKSACHAGMASEDGFILHNIFESWKENQSAELKFCTRNHEKKTEWIGDPAPDLLLSEVSIFDAHTANILVEENNNLTYIPYPMKLLEQLGEACVAVRDELNREKSRILFRPPGIIANPKCSPDTRVGELFNNFGKDINPETVNALATLSKDECVQLDELKSDILQDSNIIEIKLRAQMKRLQALQNKLRALSNAVSKENACKLRLCAKNLQIKIETEKLASRDFSKAEALNGVGSESWRKLWEAARVYSTLAANSGDDFPVSAVDARCVLCQQELGQDAAARLRRFESFVQERTQTERDAARDALDTMRDEIKSKTISMADLREETKFLGEELGNTELATLVRKWTIHLAWRLRSLLRDNNTTGQVQINEVLTSIQYTVDSLQKRIQNLLVVGNGDERKVLLNKLNDLRDREWLAEVKEDLFAEIEDNKAMSSLEAALVDTESNAIAQKNIALSKTLLTECLRAKFEEEINLLGLSGLKVELAQKPSSFGAPCFQIKLTGRNYSKVRNVFSEGEYRCVALAGFMAELATRANKSGIIFDDPVSSLDHLHREAIAKRLADEGRGRQVIVFTHDLPFLFMLRRACTEVDDKSRKTEVALRHIQKRQNIPGYCRNEAPDKAQDAVTRIKKMRQHLENCRSLYDKDPDSTRWLISARGLIDSLRQTWEAAVEDAISPVLRTFSSKVDTKGFKKLSAIKESDAKKMRLHYRQCSEMLHKASDSVNPTTPTPEKIIGELDAIEVWVSSITERQERIKH